MTPRARLIALGLAALIGLLAASPGSLWMDEFFTVHFAGCPDLASFSRRLWAWPWAEAQMPLYVFYSWVWAQGFGTGEWALRLANVPWFVLGAGGLLYGFRRSPRLLPPLLLLYGLSPFAWYYLDEARPYAALLGASVWMLSLPLAGLLQEGEPARFSPRDTLIFLAASLAACSLHLLAVPWLASTFLCLGCLAWTGRISFSVPKRQVLILALFAVPFLALGFYYLHTLQQGSRAYTTRSSALLNAGFSGYELLGFAGLGPNRFDLRTHGFAALRSFVLPLGLLAATLCWVGLFWLRARRAALRPSRITAAALLTIPPIAFLLAMNLLLDFRFLGRHLTPLLPALLVWLATAVSAAWTSRAGRAASVLLLLLLALSSLSLRFQERHANEDFRSAARVAAEALDRGEVVWWLAEPKALEYYGVRRRVPDSRYALDLASPLPPGAGPELRTVQDRRSITGPDFRPASVPDAVLLSRPSDCDPAGVVRRYLRENGYGVAESFHIFDVYRRTSPPSSAAAPPS